MMLVESVPSPEAVSVFGATVRSESGLDIRIRPFLRSVDRDLFRGAVHSFQIKAPIHRCGPLFSSSCLVCPDLS